MFSFPSFLTKTLPPPTLPLKNQNKLTHTVENDVMSTLSIPVNSTLANFSNNVDQDQRGSYRRTLIRVCTGRNGRICNIRLVHKFVIEEPTRIGSQYVTNAPK